MKTVPILICAVKFFRKNLLFVGVKQVDCALVLYISDEILFEKVEETLLTFRHVLYYNKGYFIFPIIFPF